MKFYGKEYEVIIASDIVRDGIGLELWDKSENKMLIEIFRNDAKRKVEFYTEKVVLPLELIEKVVEMFDNRIGRIFQE